MVERISRKDAWAWKARGDVLMSAVGLPAKVSLATSQSRAFFSAPGSPWAYSGAAMMRASLAPMSARRV
jgi:hypothetical protein